MNFLNFNSTFDKSTSSLDLGLFHYLAEGHLIDYISVTIAILSI